MNTVWSLCRSCWIDEVIDDRTSWSDAAPVVNSELHSCRPTLLYPSLPTWLTGEEDDGGDTRRLTAGEQESHNIVRKVWNSSCEQRRVNIDRFVSHLPEEDLTRSDSAAPLLFWDFIFATQSLFCFLQSSPWSPTNNHQRCARLSAGRELRLFLGRCSFGVWRLLSVLLLIFTRLARLFLARRRSRWRTGLLKALYK